MNTALSLRAGSEEISALIPSPSMGEGRGEGGIRRLGL